MYRVAYDLAFLTPLAVLRYSDYTGNPKFRQEAQRPKIWAQWTQLPSDLTDGTLL